MENFSPNIKLNLLSITDLPNSEDQKYYFRFRIGEQTRISDNFSYKNLLNFEKSFGNVYSEFKFTEEQLSISLFKKNLIIADHLICGGELEIYPEHLKNYSLKLLNFTTSSYICTVGFSICFTDLPKSLPSIFGVSENGSSELDLLIMSQNFKNFVESIGPIVWVYKQIGLIYAWKSIQNSMLICILIYSLIRYNMLLVLGIIGLWLWIIYSPMHKGSETQSQINTYKENLFFIQELMGNTSSSLNKAKTLIEEFIYWRKPEKTKKFKNLLEIALVPVILLSYCLSLSEIIGYFLIFSIIFCNPLVKLAVLQVFFKSKSTISQLVEPTSEKNYYKIYENQRMWFGSWKSYTFPNERNNWSDVNGNNMTKESLILQTGHKWTGDWQVENIEEGGGWEYAPDFTKSFHSPKEFWDYVRRRCWKRPFEKI